jgi:glycosyltransferase involved in cell wall biosynthesis
MTQDTRMKPAKACFVQGIFPWSVETGMGTSIGMVMPLGLNHGWGICGKYLSLEMLHLCEVDLVTEEFSRETIGDADQYRALISRSRSLEALRREAQAQGFWTSEAPVIQAIQGSNLEPCFLRVRSPRTVGYTFFEYNLRKEAVERAQDYYDVIVTGSTWCEQKLRSHGLSDCRTIIQGVDPRLFHEGMSAKTLYHERFVVFSGGKLELRKGQDLVIRAFKVLQDKYKDVLLVACWYNHWKQSLDTMALSPHIRYEMPGPDYVQAVHHLLAVNGIDPGDVICLPAMAYSQMGEIYRNTDVGLFPNRCEGGTNLVLMEYMACGKPVIASYSSGHRDVLGPRNAILLHHLKRLDLRASEGRILAEWDEPDLDEIVAGLEWAYHHRDRLKEIGAQAAKDLGQRTWKRAAEAFHSLAGCQ